MEPRRAPAMFAPRLSSNSLFGALFLVSVAPFWPGLIAGGVPKWLALYGAAAVVMACCRRVAFDHVMLAGGLLFGYAALSLLWSPDHAWGALSLHKAAILVVLFLAARAWGRKWPLTTICALSVPLLLTLAVLDPSYSAGFGNPNFAAHYFLVITPFLAAFMWKHKTHIWAWFPLAAVVVYLFAFNDSRAEYYILWLALIGFFLWRRWWGMALVTALVGGNSFLLFPSLLESIAPRFEVWLGTGAMWLEAPVFGQGLGAFGYEYPRFQDTYFALMPNHAPIIQGKFFAGAAHNEPLQMLAELGIVGVWLTGLFFWACYQASGKQGPAIFGLAILGALSLISFPLQNPVTAALGAILLGVAVGGPGESRLLRGASRWALSGVLAVAAAGSLYLGSLELRGHLAYAAAGALMKHHPAQALQANLNAYRVYPWDWQIRHQMYLTLLSVVNMHDTRIALHALTRIRNISASASPFSKYWQAALIPQEGN